MGRASTKLVLALPVKRGEVTMGSRVLVVDDEVQIVRVLRGYLEKAGYTVLMAHDGDEALRIARQESPDLVVLDLMLPGMDGLDVCRVLRKEYNLPIIMLTARVEETDRIIGLELGADDYVTKPFSPRALVARVRAVLRRAQGGVQTPSWIERAGLVIDLAGHRAELDGQPVHLTPNEFRLLVKLAQHPGQTLTREQLLDDLHGAAYTHFDRSVDSHIKNLRRKLETDPAKPRFIETVYGVGYKFIQKDEG